MTDPDDQIRSAYDALREDTSKMNANSAHQRTTKSSMPKWLVPAMGLVGVIAVVAIGLSLRDSESPTDTATAPTDSTQTEDSTAPDSSTTTPVDDATGALVPTADGFYPWIFPAATLSWYEEGCPSLDDVVVSFMSNIIGDPDPQYQSLSASEDGNRKFAVQARGENGVVTDNVTILTLVPIHPGPWTDECDAWGVVDAQSPEHVTIANVDIGSDPDTFATALTVEGEGHGFEALVDVRLLDDSYRVIGDGFGLGGNDDTLEPYEAVAVLDELPLDSNVIVVASSSTAADGAIPPFAARKMEVAADVAAVAPTSSVAIEDLGDPAAVRGVTVDDSLNVRSDAGVGAGVTGTLAPFSMTATLRGDTASVSGTNWFRVGDTGNPGLDGWVNSAYVIPIEGAIPDQEFLPAVQEIRAALMQNATRERLADFMLAHTIDAVRVSADANINPSIDPNVSVIQMSDGELELLWGYADGSGAEIRDTVDHFLAQYASNPALTKPDRIVVNERIGTSNLIDNLADTYPGATIIEFYYAGDGGDDEGFDWKSVRLAFTKDTNSGWQLIAIAGDNWTI